MFTQTRRPAGDGVAEASSRSTAPGRHIRPIGVSRRVRASIAGLLIVSVAGLASAHYVVRAGDTLSEIASRYGVTAVAIAKSNRIENPDLILVGQQLDITRTGQPATSIYVVESGDTLGDIAAEYGTTVAAIVTENDLDSARVIRVGQELRIPTGPPPDDPPRPALVMHTVAAGETLGQIAAHYGVSTASIIEANDMTNPNRIRVGQTLEIPEPTRTDGPAHGTSEPHLQCPVPNAIFINDWGFPRPGGRFHQGTDMFAPRGTAIRAPVSGTVEAVTGEVGGLQFWLTGDDGNVYIGTHMDRYGQVGRVQAGDVVGAIGDTGNARGAKLHLHFEMQINGKAANPYPHLVRACR